jgi:hypothetical protein
VEREVNMRANDEVTAEYIKELETLLDLAQEDAREWKERAKALEGQLALIRQDRRYEVA